MGDTGISSSTSGCIQTVYELTTASIWNSVWPYVHLKGVVQQIIKVLASSTHVLYLSKPIIFFFHENYII